MRGQSNAAKPPFSAQTGWSVRRKSSILAVLTTVTASRCRARASRPSAPLEEASRHLIYVRVHPSSARRGIGLKAIYSHPNDSAYSSHQAKNLAALGFSPRSSQGEFVPEEN